MVEIGQFPAKKLGFNRQIVFRNAERKSFSLNHYLTSNADSVDLGCLNVTRNPQKIKGLIVNYFS